MTTTLLIVGHGSREPSGNAEIEQFVAQWREQQPQWHIEVCYIEFAETLLPDGLNNAAQHAVQNDQKVLVLPLILNAAGHVKMDVPQAIDTARNRHPQVQFSYAPNLGACDEVLTILRRLLRRSMQQLDMPDPHTTGVIVLGRGSSDRQANGDIAKMTRWLFEEQKHELVDLAFTGVAFPRLERVVQRQVQLGMTQIVVLPYYLFTGTLIKRIERQMQHLQQQYPQVRFAHSRYFGFEKEIFGLLRKYVHAWQNNEPAVTMPCDGCKYRLIAIEAGHGGHHHEGHSHHHDHACEHHHAH